MPENQAAIENRLRDFQEGRLQVDCERSEFERMSQLASSQGSDIDTLLIKTIQTYAKYLPDRDIQYKRGREVPESTSRILTLIAQAKQGMDWITQLPAIQDKAVMPVKLGRETMDQAQDLLFITQDPRLQQFVRRTIRNLLLSPEELEQNTKKLKIPLELPLDFAEKIATDAKVQGREILPFLEQKLDTAKRIESLVQTIMQPAINELDRAASFHQPIG